MSWKKCPYLLKYYESNNCSEEDNTLKIFPTNVKFRIASEYKEYFPQDQTNNVICDLNNNFGQFGIYHIDVNNTSCHVSILKEPVNIYSRK
ncbi:hypothetical protein NQ314_018367 [Rhamnusium bicolor]|uniref:Uncharacterized protein n=1 Tax=Rhamnusium bicolor TaxID=1586634 RepID=A0AAV8WR70_9CUCU|nr:hypothetical protein NQ314_018367 [Rhamnusium bicolor]